MLRSTLLVTISAILMLGLSFTFRCLSQTTPALDSPASDAIMENVNPQRTAVYPTSAVHQLHGVVWKTPKRFAIDYRRVLTEDFTGVVSFVDIGFSDPIISKGVIYTRLTISKRQSYIFAIKKEQGDVLWTFKLTDGMSPPAVVGNAVYVVSADGNFYALDANSGLVTWQHNTRGIKWKISTSPIVVDGLAYCVAWNGIVYEIDLTTKQGRVVYKTKENLFGDPAYSDNTIFTAAEKSLYAIDTKSGLQKWKFQFKGIPGRPVIAHDTVLLRTQDGRIYCLDIRNGEQRWIVKIGGNGEIVTPFNFLQKGTQLAFYDGIVFFADDEGGKQMVFAVDGKTGQALWKLKIDDLSRPPIIADGVLYLGGVGALYAINTKTGHLEWRLNFISDDRDHKGKHVVSSPAIHDGSIYFVTDEGSFYCVN